MSTGEAPSFVSETEALQDAAMLAAKIEDYHMTFLGFADDLREALKEAFERGRRFKQVPHD